MLRRIVLRYVHFVAMHLPLLRGEGLPTLLKCPQFYVLIFGLRCLKQHVIYKSTQMISNSD